MKTYLAGDYVGLRDRVNYTCPEDRVDYTFAQIETVYDGMGQVKTDRDLCGLSLWQTPSIYLIERKLEIGKTYYEVGDWNIVARKVLACRNVETREEEPPMYFYETERWLGTTKLINDMTSESSFSKVTSLVERGRFFDNVLDALQCKKKVYKQHLRDAKKQVDEHKESILYTQKQINKLR